MATKNGSITSFFKPLSSQPPESAQKEADPPDGRNTVVLGSSEVRMMQYQVHATAPAGVICMLRKGSNKWLLSTLQNKLQPKRKRDDATLALTDHNTAAQEQEVPNKKSHPAARLDALIDLTCTPVPAAARPAADMMMSSGYEAQGAPGCAVDAAPETQPIPPAPTPATAPPAQHAAPSLNEAQEKLEETRLALAQVCAHNLTAYNGLVCLLHLQRPCMASCIRCSHAECFHLLRVTYWISGALAPQPGGARLKAGTATTRGVTAVV